MTTTGRVTRLLGGRQALGAAPRNELELVSVVRRGLPFRSMKHALDATGLSLREASKLLGLNARTLTRRSSTARLTLVESERFIRLARVFARSQEVFDDPARARTWLRQPVRALGGVAPIDLLDTDLGTEAVLTTLGRMEWGVYS